MMAAVRGNGMRKTLFQHLSDQEMNMKVDNRRSTIHAHSQNFADCPEQKDRFSCYQLIGARGRLWVNHVVPARRQVRGMSALVQKRTNGRRVGKSASCQSRR